MAMSRCCPWTLRHQHVAGRRVLEASPDTPGSLGIAISEAVEVGMSAEFPLFAHASLSVMQL